MNILILTSNLKEDDSHVSYSLFKAFTNKGYNVEIISKGFNGTNHKQIKGINTRRKRSQDIIKRKIKLIFNGYFKRPKVNNKYYYQDIYEPVTFIKTKSIIEQCSFVPDIIMVHFNMDFLNARNLYQLNKITGAPILILLMDMAPITGGCHYAWDCKGYLTGCGQCPGLDSNKTKDLSARIFNFRKKYFSKTNLHVIAASSWQVKQVNDSGLTSNLPVKLILSAFNIDVFKPVPKRSAKEALEIPIDNKIIFFGAASVTEERKGLVLLLKALSNLKEQVKSENILLLIAGNVDQDFLDKLPFKHKSLGFINDNQLSMAFNAADVYACSSVEDSGPTMINMSMLCGTPVVSFKMGVSEDLIVEGETGYSADLYNVPQFAEYLNKVLSLSENECNIMSAKCREIGLRKCDPKIQSENYDEYLNTLISNEE